MEANDGLFTVSEISQRLGVSASRVSWHVRNAGVKPVWQAGPTHIFDRDGANLIAASVRAAEEAREAGRKRAAARRTERACRRQG